MLLLFVVTTIGTRGFIELFPGFADRVFGRGPEGLAMLTSTVGLGAIFAPAGGSCARRFEITRAGSSVVVRVAFDDHNLAEAFEREFAL